MMPRLPLLLALLLGAALPAAAGASGRTNYLLRCAGCHGMEGLGTEIGGVPAFPGSVGLLASDDAARTYMMHVPGVVGASLDDAEIAEVTNYIVERWGGTGAPAFTAEEVTRRRAAPVANVVALRSEIAARMAAEGKTLAPYPWP